MNTHVSFSQKLFQSGNCFTTEPCYHSEQALPVFKMLQSKTKNTAGVTPELGLSIPRPQLWACPGLLHRPGFLRGGCNCSFLSVNPLALGAF